MRPLIVRLWIYQAERFPLARTVPLLGMFSLASVTASANLAGRALPPVHTYLVAFCLALVFFWQMRAADEVKDAAIDRAYRPERPIPRGLVSLRLIGGLGLAAALPAAAAAAALSVGLLLAVGLVWAWMALMTVEFFIPRRLHASPGLYLVSHMAVMPLIDLVLTGCEWLPAAASPPAGIWTFLWMSFCNGCVVEFGRKIWASEQERPGVDTYSSRWGRRRSLLALAMAALGALAGLLAFGGYAGGLGATVPCGVIALAYLLFAVRRLDARPTPRAQARLETASGVWVLACYLIAAVAPSVPAILR